MSTRDELPPTRAVSQIVCKIPIKDLGARSGKEVLAHLAERGMVVLGPDGEPLDVRPALRALVVMAGDMFDQAELKVLGKYDVPRPLAGLCLAAAEVEG